MASDFTDADGHTRSSRGTWRMRWGGAINRVHSRRSLGVGEKLPHSSLPTTAELSDWAKDPCDAEFVHQMFEAAYGYSLPRLSTHKQSGWLVARLEDAFRQGHLVLTRETPLGVGMVARVEEDDSATAASPPVAPVKSEEKTWFRAQLFDEDGQAMAKEDYVLIDTLGTRRQGKLDENGEVYIPVLPPGNCTISFPNIHLNPRKRK